MSKEIRNSRSLPLLALLLAWVVPGAGHVYLGQVRRGIIIFVTISATFWAGVGIGGAMTVDHENERWWFMAAMLTGANGLAGWLLHRTAMEPVTANLPPGQAWSGRKMLLDKKLAAEQLALVSPVDTIARAYTGVAGLLNLMCIFDALMLALMGVVGRPKPLPIAHKHKAAAQ